MPFSLAAEACGEILDRGGEVGEVCAAVVAPNEAVEPVSKIAMGADMVRCC